ncbi:MAG: CAAX prenyl protease-related protein [Verrucomicrobiae bacterium]|nr:CAAX prenyl protease-related protein [Verrucomicrobiae bacterium]
MEKTSRRSHPAAPYVAPFLIYMVFLAAEGRVAAVHVIYPLKTLAVAAALVWAWRGVREALQTRAGQAFGALVGVLALGVWIAPEALGWTKTDFTTGNFNPTWFESPHREVLTAVRVAGAVLVVPVMEELFWRGWLIRWLVNEDFRSVPVGTFTWRSFAITVVFFGLEHGSLWHVGMITGALYNGLLYRTRSLRACMIAHAVTNLLLAAYVLATGRWGYW